MFGCGMILKRSDGVDLNAFYPVRPECNDDARKTRFKVKPGKTLSARKWHAAFSEKGHMDIAKVLRRIQRGGVHPSIRGVVWEFLLGCFDPNSTFDERNQLRQQRREQYGIWKAECQKMVPLIGSGRVITLPIKNDNDQQLNADKDCNGAVSTSSLDPSISHEGLVENMDKKKVKNWKLILHQIGLDVVRTDRALSFYESEINQAKLWDVLAVYAWVDSDIGYVQGMNDICSPMVILLEHEADAFWCFERAMRRLRENFRCTTSSIGVQSQLGTLSTIIKTIDPQLHQHLEDLDGGAYLFAFRMLMVLFRRELSFVDALYLWELIWAMEYNPNIFSMYKEERTVAETALKVDEKLLMKQCGKFEKEKVKTGHVDHESALAVFLVASVLETKNKALLKEAKGLDDVVKILGETTGKLDAKKACKVALKIQKKYLNKTKQS
ncbi:rab GTPase-activating protein 22 isoform X1 [Syzygium oleosum]|uniref:rab GTPase-activating protein 22 isoform X1 n=1 Tax=Syzygium oleosum TaxID=219896 RepID=UPI0024BB1AC5|nr:rab GTPase-activating protein 22 isoform X1 [Syzygium oleosum]XP_056163687.1 rab GTPase-activating protein 22 isoform X1 [Syzygium oleosum]